MSVAAPPLRWKSCPPRGAHPCPWSGSAARRGTIPDGAGWSTTGITRGKGAPARMLEEYAAFPLFRTVGIDSSFYAPPTEEVLRGLCGAPSAGLPLREQGLEPAHRPDLHQGAGPGPRREGQRATSSIPRCSSKRSTSRIASFFADHTGPFVFEFQAVSPRSGIGARASSPSRLDHFFAELPRDAEYAVEVRNEEFLTPMYFAVLREHGVAHVFSSWTRMPAIGEQLDLPGSVSGPFIVARALLRPGTDVRRGGRRLRPL